MHLCPSCITCINWNQNGEKVCVSPSIRMLASQLVCMFWTVTGFRLNLVHVAYFKNSYVNVILSSEYNSDFIWVSNRILLIFLKNDWDIPPPPPYVFVVSADIFSVNSKESLLCYITLGSAEALGLCPSSNSLNNMAFRKLDFFLFPGEMVGCTSITKS